jgi:hypothetical protein
MFHIEGMFHSNLRYGEDGGNAFILVQIMETETKIVISFVLVWNFRRRLHPKMESRLPPGRSKSEMYVILPIWIADTLRNYVD